MDRRGFLKRMSAAVAAFSAAASGGVSAAAGGNSVPAAAGPSTPLRGVDLAVAARTKSKPKTPCVAITADTSKFEKSIGEAGAEVVRLLRECRVTSSNWGIKAGELKRFSATFEQAPSGAPASHLDAEAWQIIEKGYLTSVNVEKYSDLDVVHLGELKPIKFKPNDRYRVTAEWIVRD